jgi:hypothetical protein
MSNFIYGKTKEALFNGLIDISSNNIKLLLIDVSQYTANQNSDQFVSNIPPSAIKARSSALQNVSNTLGIIDADDVIIGSYSGAPFSAIVLYVEGFNDSNSRLIFYIDNSPGLPFTGSQSAAPVTITWNNGPEKIISI